MKREYTGHMLQLFLLHQKLCNYTRDNLQF